MSLFSVVSRKSGRNLPRRPGQISGIIRNAGWILAGKGIGGIFGLVYLGLAARALGSAGLGEFVLILSFGQAVANIAQFQTSEVLIRFGVGHLRQGGGDRFTRLIIFSAGLDALSAIACIALALGAVVVIGPMVKLAGEDQIRAAVFATSFIFSIRGTPVGILRLLDRFDVAALSEVTLPAVRLFAAALCYAFAPKVDWFLASWAAAEMVTTAVIWVAAIRQLPRREQLERSSRSLRLRNVVPENPGLWRFAWFTNFASTVWFLRQQSGTLLVGWGDGVMAAGAYRVSQQLALALSKPVAALSRAVYPDLNHIAAEGGTGAVMKLTSKLSVIGAGIGIVAVVVVALAGKWMLTFVAGPEFSFASPLLLLLTMAAAVELWGFGQEPALLALGRAGVALSIRAAVAILSVTLSIVLLLRFGAEGAAFAVLIGSIAFRLSMAAALRHFARIGHPSYTLGGQQ